MKKLTALVFGLLLLALPKAASAHEGSIQLSNSDISCEGVSLWRESSFHILGRCQGLVYPYSTLNDHYVIWAKMDNGNSVRIDDVDRGYFEGSVNSTFSGLEITAETSSSPRRPSNTQVLSGNIDPFAFDKSSTTTITPTATPAPARNTTQNNAATSSSTTTVSNVVGRILKALLVIVAVIILITVVASLIFRRRGSVSA